MFPVTIRLLRVFRLFRGSFRILPGLLYWALVLVPGSLSRLLLSVFLLPGVRVLSVNRFVTVLGMILRGIFAPYNVLGGLLRAAGMVRVGIGVVFGGFLRGAWLVRMVTVGMGVPSSGKERALYKLAE